MSEEHNVPNNNHLSAVIVIFAEQLRNLPYTVMADLLAAKTPLKSELLLLIDF